jgi:hypothetical protein
MPRMPRPAQGSRGPARAAGLMVTPSAIHKAQLLSYMKLPDAPLGLLVNFHEVKLVAGVSRLIISGVDKF